MGTKETMTAKFFKVKANLTSLDRQPLSKASLIILLFLDIFILTSIFDGLERHTRQLAAPDDYIPSSCREIVINQDWTPSNRTDHLSGIILSHNNSYYQIEADKKGHHPICTPYLDLLDQIKNDKEVFALFADHAKFNREATRLQRDIAALKGAYDTSLLETMAEQKEGQPKVDKIKQEVQTKTDTLNTLQAQLETATQRVNGNGKVKQLWERVESLTPTDREQLKTDLRTMHFWHPVKRLAMQMIFLLPLFAIFYLWSSASIRKNRGIQALVSSHLLVVSFIPIFFKIIETVYDIIPKKLLKELIALLESLKLVAIWNYLIIAVTVAVALFLIYLFQKKLFSHDKLMERRIAKGLCQQCERRLPPGAQACPFCGFAQFKACGVCKQPTLVNGKFCQACGKEQPPADTD